MGNLATRRTSSPRVARVLFGLAFVVGLVLVLGQNLLRVMTAERPEISEAELSTGFFSLGYLLIVIGACGLLLACSAELVRAWRGRRDDVSAPTPLPPSRIHPSADAALATGAAAADEMSSVRSSTSSRRPVL